MTNTRVKFFFTSPSERECYVYVERGKGFTEARQFPQKGNPWLKELSPEEFAYNVQLAWPFSEAEYRARDAKPLPVWEDVPGGNFYRDEDEQTFEDEDETTPSDLLPRDFKLLRDEEWERQIGAIQALFADEEGDEPSIGPLFTDGEEAALPHEDVRKMQQEILSSISDRGPDRSRCIVNLIFENYLSGATDAPSWKDLWRHCWEEPLDSRKGADVQRSANVRQAVYRVREILDRFFEEPAGRKWRVRASIQLEEYRLVFEPHLRDTDHGSGPPMIDSEEESEEE